MRAAGSVAVAQYYRSQKGIAGVNSICFFSFIVLIGFSTCHSFLKAESASKVSFFEKKAEGWHWYEDPLSGNEVKKKEERQQEKKHEERNSQFQRTPTERIEAQRKALEEKLHRAILEPARENIIAYIIAQRALMDQSQKFSEAWRQAVLTTPSLDETLIHPVDQNARHIYYDEKHKELASHIIPNQNENWVLRRSKLSVTRL